MTMSGSMHPIVRKLKQSNHIPDQQIVVIKIGGSVLAELPDYFFKELLYLLKEGWFPILIHGGGPSITNMLSKLGLQSTFINGLRVTDDQTLDVVEMVLNCKENKEIVKRIHKAGGKAIGLSGIDLEMILAEQIDSDLGYVGRVKKFSFPMLSTFQLQEIIPVISPLGVDEKGQVYNINADTVAKEVAIQLQVKKIFMISDIPGIYHNKKGERKIINLLTPEDINQLMELNQFTGGMIPKVEAALHCIEQGISEVFILDGREEGILTKVYDHQLVGTRIHKEDLV